MAHDFPGNIRELENIIEYATVICKNSLIGIEHLPDYLRQGHDISKRPQAGESTKGDISLQDMERDFLYKALQSNNWNRKTTAAQLGIHATTLWRKIKQFGIVLPKQDGRTKNS